MNTGIEFAEKLSKAYSETCKPLCHELNIPQTAFDILLFLANNPEYKRDYPRRTETSAVVR